ncbi:MULTISPECIES: helix-turn-helix domain-containing protein [unclassified Fusibacter]|uniref:helix-turn-helix domain-containing protein n=1 Tax=unclassified Fusibacter TaxID=2624464 RepID=UPI0010104D00|nr:MULTISPECIES: helix-turn-helix transcriptional regulator [unclassified Fusibacter]MCK8059120.1 helix-turn-helix domain-containing protein [Fusibacter sp. A2]NPE22529.1 helix-turn-helix transcriptional regulator [Fusibacter sp. A1]RXV60631.1 XRE family transcriptional regulator [Fusibacter sp. A1]
MDINFKEYGRLVTEIRKNCYLTQNDVQKKIGVSMETLRRIENGIQEPRISTLERLSVLYKYDLISMLEKTRKSTSFFSDDLIKRVNKHTRENNFEALKQELTSIVEVLAYHSSENNSEAYRYYVQYLESIKSLTISSDRFPKNKITNFESLLVSMNSSRTGLLTDEYLFNLEVAIAIGLSVVYRDYGNNDKTIDLLTPLIEKLLRYPTHTARQINFIGTMVLNLAYAYHMLDEHEKVITAIDDILQNKLMTFSTDLTNELYKRKAVALFKLDNPLYKPLFLTVLMHESGEKRKQTCHIIKKQYKIDLGHCFNCHC